MLHQRLAFASQLLRGPGRYYACYTVGRSTVHIRTLISVIRRTPFPKVASRTIFAPLRQRFLNSSSFKNNDDWPNDVIPLLMKKRDILVTQRQEKAVSDPVVAKEIAELDSLHKILLEWCETKKSFAHLSEMSLPDFEPDEGMRALAEEEVEQVSNVLSDLQRRIVHLMIPRDPIEEQNAIIEVRPGVGGSESALFTAEIARMYMRFCEKGIADSREDEDSTPSSFEVEQLSATPLSVSVTGGGGSSEAYREVILSVKGSGAYGLLRHEAGVHRVQRIPATQNLGKIQTSTIAVIVLPAGSEKDEAVLGSARDDVVDPKDVKIEVMRSRGAGGQHVNKTESAVRLTHEPTGITVSMQDSRSQHQNRTKAWAILRARLLDRKLQAEAEENRDVRRSQIGSMQRHERVRTYNFPQDRVTDHRLPLTMKGLDYVLDGENEGGLGYLIHALQQHQDTLSLRALKERIEQDIVTLQANQVLT